jgi:hypothetical protein
MMLAGHRSSKINGLLCSERVLPVRNPVIQNLCFPGRSSALAIINSPADADLIINMPLTIALNDETTSGESRSAGTFQFDNANLTLRDLIRLRVQQEVARFNEADYEVFRGLVQPEESERILNGVRTRPTLDWQKQFAKAITAFNGNGFLVLIDDRQIIDLDECLSITSQSKITFLKLVPLIGG